MTSKEIGFFKKMFCSYQGKKLRVLEWGCGWSTVYYAKYLKSLKTTGRLEKYKLYLPTKRELEAEIQKELKG